MNMYEVNLEINNRLVKCITWEQIIPIEFLHKIYHSCIHAHTHFIGGNISLRFEIANGILIKPKSCERIKENT